MDNVAAFMYNTDRAASLLKRFETAKQKRSQFVNIWQEVANYILPYRGGFYDVDNSGSISAYDRNAEIYDDTATNALIKSASAFYSYTANPATQWFSLSLTSAKGGKKNVNSVYNLMRNSEVKAYLEEVAESVAYYINSNSQAGLHALAQEVIASSVSALYILEDPTDNIINIQPISVKDLFVLNDAQGGVGEVYRTTVLTNEQVVMQFQSSGMLSSEIIDAGLNNPLKERTLVHAVVPRLNRDASMPDALNMPWASLWIDLQTRSIIQESGFEEMPYAVARINVPAGSIYGFSPAMNVRHTVKSLNKVVKQKLSAGDLALTPSMNVPVDTYINPLSLKPAALNYHEADAQFRAEPMHTVGNFQINTETIKDAREQVRQGMMIDLIEQKDKDNTYQAMQEQLLQLKLMSPWQGGIEKDCLKPLVMRVFNILMRRGGVLPEMPGVLQDAFRTGFVKLKICYESPLAKAQQHFKLSATEQSMAFAMQMAQFGSMDLINMEDTMRLYVELVGAPSKILYSSKQLSEIRSQQAKVQEQQQGTMDQMAQMQQMKEGASAYKDVTQAQAAAAQAGGPQMQGQPQLPPELQGIQGLPA